MVSTAVFCAPRLAPPWGLLSVSSTVSSPSTIASVAVGTLNVAEVLPGRNVRMPVCAA